MAFRQLVENANDLDFEPVVERANQALICKTIATKAALQAVHTALEVTGGAALYRTHELERLLRDIQGAPFHPLPEMKQLAFTGRVALGLPPVG
jgi:alkylation response protein AidB-like acyl-CoA dehydrogenase